MDEIDIKIIEVLKQNGRATASEISKKVGLSIPAVAERMRKLEQVGIIGKYTVMLNRLEAGYEVLAFVLLELDGDERDVLKALTSRNHVLECHHITGDYDYLLKMLFENMRALEDMLASLKKAKGIKRLNTILVLSTIKEEINL